MTLGMNGVCMTKKAKQNIPKYSTPVSHQSYGPSSNITITERWHLVECEVTEKQDEKLE